MRQGEARRTWDYGTARAAASACAAQLPVAGLVAFLLTVDQADGGSDGGSAFGLACGFPFAVLVLPVLGMLHSAVLTLPAVWLGRRGCGSGGGRGSGDGRGFGGGRGPEWGWSLGCLLPVGGVWAGVLAVLGAPFGWALLWCAASGVVPALNVAYSRRREQRLGRPLRKVWLVAAVVSFGVCVLVVLGALVSAAAVRG
ncbi:hypothetical protein ABZ921_07220 [Streptomyces atriruber]|uniref:Integral membrane protein n=1 Tax=Streptomyces atriruber TaxID=545121 RepID=A0ABV3BIE2_9ACTN